MKTLFGIITLLAGLAMLVCGLGAMGDEPGIGLFLLILGAVVGFTGFKVLKA